ncbi:siderophore biosynthesis protein [Paenibacillus sp. N4]|uniref:IucA/IucC family protein n=1 Tax=Paenibacillus vietnamensis TaxID=2590547 RepID=UPI001CD18AD0|nr:IucA/IucC family protein [Paenibacillus vietnamensis]MCA0757539.1 siderophore biosynthesis protein [Paenibacillus vietnamensis]
MEPVWQQDLMAARAMQSEAGLRVRRRIFRQLAESVLYEGIVTPQTETDGQNTIFSLQGRDAEGRRVIYRCIGRRRLTFGRIRLLADFPIIRIDDESEAEASSLRQFVWEALNVPGADPAKLAAFAEELEQTFLKDAVAQYARAQNGAVLRGLGGDELESAVMDGHRYHPSYKSRIGFDHADHLAYGPEFARDLTPLWLAVHKEDSRAAVLPDMTLDGYMSGELGAEGVQALHDVLRGEGCDPADYLLLPVHPWQWRRAIAPACAEELRLKRIVMLGAATDVYRAQQSIRTLANRTEPRKAYMKLSMNLLNTSSSRQLLPHYTVTAPVLSAWLQALVDGDPYLKEEAGLILLREAAAVTYDPPVHRERQEKPLSQHHHPHPSDGSKAGSGHKPVPAKHPLYAAAGCIWRESVHRYLRQSEETTPFYALFAEELDGTPFIDPWLQTYGIEPWLSRLLEKCVLPVAHMAAVHGVALEAHAQNMVMVHRNGLPERLALKDFHEDVLYCRSFLGQPELCPDLPLVHELYELQEERANFEAESVHPLRYLTLGALLFVNLGELAMLLEDKYGFEEERFWRLTSECIHSHQERNGQWKARFEALDLFAPTTRVEQLTYKRLAAQTKGLSHEVPNPLSAFHPNRTLKSREEIRL